MRAMIVNPAAGGGRTAGRWRRIVEELERRGPDPSLRLAMTARRGGAIDLTRALVKEGVRRFVVLGGDGTIGEVVAGCARPDGSAMLADDIELAIVHAGTGGDVVRGLGIPRSEDAAIGVAIDGVPMRVDVGMARFAPRDGAMPDETRAFVSTANIGMSADVVRGADGWIKRLGRSAAFAIATTVSLARNTPRHIQYGVDDAAEQRATVVDLAVCNNRFLGGGMQMAPNASMHDGALDVVRIDAASRLRLLRAFPKIYPGRHLDDPLVHVSRGAQVRVGTPDELPAQRVVLDGELVGWTPARFTLLDQAISILVPREQVR